MKTWNHNNRTAISLKCKKQV